jgi:hypothetical protein
MTLSIRCLCLICWSMLYIPCRASSCALYAPYGGGTGVQIGCTCIGCTDWYCAVSTVEERKVKKSTPGPVLYSPKLVFIRFQYSTAIGATDACIRDDLVLITAGM